MIDLQEHSEGTTIPVLAQPGSKRTAVLGERNGHLRLAVAAPPDKGRANVALTQLLAETLGLRSSSIALLTGSTHRQKRFLVRGLNLSEVRQRLQSLCLLDQG